MPAFKGGLYMSLLDNIEELLAGGESFALAMIVSRKGSAPRDVGTRMVVRNDASTVGTIGGGLLEAQVRDLAMEVLASRESVVKKYSFTAEDAAEMCMICGGVIEVLVHFVDASQSSTLVLYQQINAALRSQKRAWLITEIPSGGKQSGPSAPWLHLEKQEGTVK
jgi:xanthine dehydrogenase accessory factor